MTQGAVGQVTQPARGASEARAADPAAAAGGGPYASETDLEALPEFRPVEPLNVLIGWGAGRGPGGEPLPAPGEARALLAERRRFIERSLPDYAALPARTQQAVLRAFERGWRSGRRFEYMRTRDSSGGQAGP